MDKFWKWMEEKVGIEKTSEASKINFPKQMLIGYMIEYIYCREKHEIYYGFKDITIDIDEGMSDINTIYDNLEKKIQEETE